MLTLSGLRESAEIACECTLAFTTPSPMLQCDICLDFKHLSCYGYLTAPIAEFVCYSCLLVSEKTLLSEMKEICKKRHILAFLRDGGNASDLGNHMTEQSTLHKIFELSVWMLKFLTKSLS